MADNHRTIFTIAALILLLGTAPAYAQPSGGNGRANAQARTGAHPQSGAQATGRPHPQTTNRQTATGANRDANANRNTNRDVNVNRNVNVNVNRNVHWNGNNWGGARVAAPRYAWPHGYAYSRRPVGWIMPRVFLASAYYYTAWATLGLVAPPPHYQWVRCGPDLLLVNTATGHVQEVRYGIFEG